MCLSTLLPIFQAHLWPTLLSAALRRLHWWLWPLCLFNMLVALMHYLLLLLLLVWLSWALLLLLWLLLYLDRFLPWLYHPSLPPYCNRSLFFLFTTLHNPLNLWLLLVLLLYLPLRQRPHKLLKFPSTTFPFLGLCFISLNDVKRLLMVVLLHYLQDPQQYIYGITNVLKPDDCLLFSNCEYFIGILVFEARLLGLLHRVAQILAVDRQEDSYWVHD